VAAWKSMTDAQKAPFVAEASKNLAKRNEIRQSFKKPAGKYALFVKKHFPAKYAEALKTTSDRKAAFKAATKAVSAAYKAQ